MPKHLTPEDVKRIHSQLRRCDSVRRGVHLVENALRIMGYTDAANALQFQMGQLAIAEGEIAQAVFGSREYDIYTVLQETTS